MRRIQNLLRGGQLNFAYYQWISGGRFEDIKKSYSCCGRGFCPLSLLKQSRSPFSTIPHIGSKPFVKLRFMAYHKDAALVIFKGTF